MIKIKKLKPYPTEEEINKKVEQAELILRDAVMWTRVKGKTARIWNAIENLQQVPNVR